MGWIQSASGKRIDILDPNPKQVAIEDIAHALSHVCRFAGHSGKFYSVAQHSMIVSMECPHEHRLAGLLHDATEAYIGDVTSPLKRLPCMAGYRELEDAWADAIGRKFGVELERLPEIVKVNDLRALLTERRDLMPPMACSVGEWYGKPGATLPEPFNYTIIPRDSEYVRGLFLRMFAACQTRGS